jgi:hypothetical protein
MFRLLMGIFMVVGFFWVLIAIICEFEAAYYKTFPIKPAAPGDYWKHIRNKSPTLATVWDKHRADNMNPKEFRTTIIKEITGFGYSRAMASCIYRDWWIAESKQLTK